MNDPAPLAKISRPQLRNVYPRTRLFKQLDQSRKQSIVWITGPPGAGKTTLVNSYIERRRLPCLWFQCDEGDADPATFFHYLGLAAGGITTGRRAPLSRLTPEYTLALPIFARNFFRELCGRLAPPFVVVFDNYQEVPTDADLHQLLSVAFEEIPKGGTAVIVSRDEPPAPLARLQVNQVVDHIGWDALRLTQEELAAIVHLTTDGDITDADLAQLQERTQGWLAGVILLAAQPGESSPDVRTYETAAPQLMFDYFAGEVFNKADADTQRLLVRTAFLPHVSAKMAQILSGVSGATKILGELNTRHYFTDPIGREDSLYRYHPLFQTFLQTRAKETLSSEKLAQLLEQSASLLEAEDQIEPAIELLIEANAWEKMARLIGKHAPRLLAEGRNRTLEGWLDSLPSTLVERDAWCLYWRGTACAPFNPAQALDYLEKAFERFRTAGDPAGLYLAWATIVDSQSYVDVTSVLLDRWMATLEGLRGEYPAFPSGEIETRVTRAAFYALMWRHPQHPDLQLWRERLEAFFYQETDAERRLHLAEPLFHHSAWVGDFAKATSLFNRLHESGYSADVTPFTQMRWCLTTATFRWFFSGQWDECKQAINRGLELSETTGIHVMEPLLLGNGIFGRLACGDTATAAELLERQAQVTIPGSVTMDKALHYSLASWHALQCNDAERATQYAREALTLSRNVPFANALDHLRLTHALLQSGQHDEAVKDLVRAERIAKGMRSVSLQSECLLTRAQLAFEKNETATGVKQLRAAFALGKRSGCRGSPLARPKVDAELFMKALEQGIEVEHVQELIRVRRLFPEEPPFHLDNWPWALKVYTLGEFSVLRDDRILEFPVQAQRKRLALLKAVIAFGGRAVTEEQLSEALWPDAEGGAAHQDFATTLHRLRKALDAEDAIVLRDRQVSLDPRYCWVDTWAFEQWASQIEAAAEVTNTEIALADKAIALYRGPFLAQDTDQSWTLAPRERLRSKFLRLVNKLAQHVAQRGQWEQAITYYHKGLEVDPLAEEFYRQLMSCYVALNRPAEALALYERCQQTLRASLGIIPTRETRALFDQVRAAQEN